MDPTRRHRSRSRRPRSSSRGQLQSRLAHGLAHGAPAPPLASSSSTGAQRESSPVRRQATPASSVASGPPWEPNSRLTTPPAAPLRNSGSPSNNGRGRGQSGPSASPVAGKSKRVRTGCLTCRERHLKCDEGLPECNNCRKSNRECRRGIRLNFIDVQVKDPPCLPPTADWSCSSSFLPTAAAMLAVRDVRDMLTSVSSSSNLGRVTIYCFRIQGRARPVSEGRSITVNGGSRCIPPPAN